MEDSSSRKDDVKILFEEFSSLKRKIPQHIIFSSSSDDENIEDEPAKKKRMASSTTINSSTAETTEKNGGLDALLPMTDVGIEPELISQFSELLDEMEPGHGSFSEKVARLISRMQQLNSENEKLRDELKLLSSASTGSKEVQVILPHGIQLSRTDEEFLQAKIDELTERFEGRKRKQNSNKESPLKKKRFFPDYYVDVEADASDGTPAIARYSSFSGQELLFENASNDDQTVTRSSRQKSCFNCGETDHMIGDCPQPRDPARIRYNKSLIPSRQNSDSSRYHAEDLKPGVVSDGLREALGLGARDLPPWIYQMRIIGYPPGYVKTALKHTSSMAVYDDGLEGVAVEPEPPRRLSEGDIPQYPGFNVPTPHGINDMAKKWTGLTEMQEAHQISVFVGSLNRSLEQEQAEKAPEKPAPTTVDMDVSDGEEQAMLPPPPPPPPPPAPAPPGDGLEAMGMDELEKERERLRKDMEALDRQDEAAPSCLATPMRFFTSSQKADGTPTGLETGSRPQLDSFAARICPFEALPDSSTARPGIYRKIKRIVSAAKTKLRRK